MLKLILILSLILQIQSSYSQETITYDNLKSCETNCKISYLFLCNSTCENIISNKNQDFQICQDFQDLLANNPGKEDNLTQLEAGLYMDCFYQAFYKDQQNRYAKYIFACSFNCISKELEDLGYENTYEKYADPTYGEKSLDFISYNDANKCLNNCDNTYYANISTWGYFTDCLEYLYLQDTLEKGQGQQISLYYYSEEEAYFYQQCFVDNSNRFRYYSSSIERNQMNCKADCFENQYEWNQTYQHLTLNSQHPDNFKTTFEVEDCFIECYNTNNCDTNCINQIGRYNGYSNCQEFIKIRNYDYNENDNLQYGYLSEDYINYDALCWVDNINSQRNYTIQQKNSIICIINECLDGDYQAPVDSGSNSGSDSGSDSGSESGSGSGSDSGSGSGSGSDQTNDDNQGIVNEETGLGQNNMPLLNTINTNILETDNYAGTRKLDFIKFIDIQGTCNLQCYQDCNQNCQSIINANYEENNYCILFDQQMSNDENQNDTSSGYISPQASEYYSKCIESNIKNYTPDTQAYNAIQCESQCIKDFIKEQKIEKGMEVELTECPGSFCYNEISNCLNACETHLCQNLSCLSSQNAYNWMDQLEYYSCGSDFKTLVQQIENLGQKKDFSIISNSYQQALGQCLINLQNNSSSQTTKKFYDCSYGCTKLPEQEENNSQIIKFIYNNLVIGVLISIIVLQI